MNSIVMYVALFTGAVGFLAILFAWIRKPDRSQVMGGALAFICLILIGLPVFTTIKLKMSTDGIETTIETLQSRVDSVAASQEIVTETVEDVATGVETTRDQVLALSQALENPQRIAPGQLEAIRRNLRSMPEIRFERLDTAREMTPHPSSPARAP